MARTASATAAKDKAGGVMQKQGQQKRQKGNHSQPICMQQQQSMHLAAASLNS
jgi:hypothetical protein